LPGACAHETNARQAPNTQTNAQIDRKNARMKSPINERGIPVGCPSLEGPL